MKILNKMGPNIEPCGILDKSIWKSLSGNERNKSQCTVMG